MANLETGRVDQAPMRGGFSNRYEDSDDEDLYYTDDWGYRYIYYKTDPIVPKKWTLTEIAILLVLIVTQILFTKTYNGIANNFFPKNIECVTSDIEINVFNATKSWTEERIKYQTSNVKTYEIWHRFYCKDFIAYKMRKLIFRTNDETIFLKESKTITNSLKINDTIRGCLAKSFFTLDQTINYYHHLLYRQSKELCEISGEIYTMYLMVWFLTTIILMMPYFFVWKQRSRIVKSVFFYKKISKWWHACNRRIR